jgi:CTP:molybdopterin cytidylyltransferase MocA
MEKGVGQSLTLKLRRSSGAAYSVTLVAIARPQIEKGQRLRVMTACDKSRRSATSAVGQERSFAEPQPIPENAHSLCVSRTTGVGSVPVTLCDPPSSPREPGFIRIRDFLQQTPLCQ